MLVRPCVQNVSGKDGKVSPSGYSLHSRVSGPEVVQGDVTTSPTLLAPSWCGASRGIWDYCWSWGISGPPRAASPATLPKGKSGTNVTEWIIWTPTLKLSIYETVFSLFAKSECRIETIKHILTETCVFMKIS